MNTLFNSLRALFRPGEAKGVEKGLSLSHLGSRGGWMNVVRESFSGAWQQNVEIRQDTVLANFTVFACLSLISSSIGKLRLRLVEKDKNGIWDEVESSAFSPVLRKPNRFQTRQKFVESWVLSKLSRGNAYILKARDERGVVTSLYVLDPDLVQPLVAPDGAVFYQLSSDELSGVPHGMPAIPASEIIHDIAVPLFHPLIGVSPLHACGLAAMQGVNMQKHSARFFANAARPSGILTTTQDITESSAQAAKKYWNETYNTGSESAGGVAILGQGFKFENLTHNSVDSELVEQLKLTAAMVCSVFAVPPHMVAAGPVPTAGNVESLTLAFYSNCLQQYLEQIEALLDEGLGLNSKVGGRQLGTEFDLDDLLKTDRATLLNQLKVAVDGAITSPNEARRRINLGPVAGGDSPLAQQQYYSLAALAERDSDKPFSKPAPAAQPATPAVEEPDEEGKEDGLSEEDLKGLMEYLQKGLTCEQI